MKKLIALLLMVFPVLTAQAKGDWKGKVVDENGEPLPYATVAVLSQVDSTVLCDVTTMEDGGIYNLGANLYYNGTIGGKLGVDVNLDYYGTDNSSISESNGAAAFVGLQEEVAVGVVFPELVPGEP